MIPAPESIALSTFTDQMDEVTRTVALSGHLPQFPLVMALLSGDPRVEGILSSQRARLIIEADRKLDRKLLRSLLVDRGTAICLRLLIDPDTKLVRQVQEFYPYSPHDLARMDKEVPPRRMTIARSWSASSIQIGADPADLFTYRPPQDFTRVGNFMHSAAAAETMSVAPLVFLMGKPAPDFTLNVLDTQGSIRKVSKSDLAGKVVVIVYWSIDDEPCFEELREIRKIVEAGSGGRKAVLVALNVDEEYEDVKALTVRVRQVLADKKVGFDVSGAMVAVDPTGEFGELLPVAALPAFVLLDSKGILQSYYVGSGEDVSATLAKEIETLLAGKSLERPDLDLLRKLDADESRPTFLTEDPGELAKIEELGGEVIRAGGRGRGADQIYVQLSGKGPTDALLAKLVPHLRRLSKITGLHLQNTRITDRGLEPLMGMSNIVSLNLEGTAISDRGLDTLETIRSLRHLILTGTRVSDDGILALKQALPKLHVEKLSSAEQR